MPATNAQLAAIFQQMADLVEITGGNKFKALAYQKVARTLGDLTRDVADIQPDLLEKVEGIGSGSAERIAEFLDTAQIAEHRQLLALVPPGLLKILDVPGLGPKGVALLWREGGVDSLDTLAAKLDTGELTKLKGFGPKKLDNLKKNLAFAAHAGQRIRLSRAAGLARSFVDLLRPLPGVERIEPAGSLRRGRETIGDLDLVVAAEPGHVAAVFDAFVAHPLVHDVLLRGDTKASARVGTREDAQDLVQVDLRIVPLASFGAALLYFTGSKEHNVRLRERAIAQGMSLNEYALTRDGRPVASATESEIYEALGLAYVPPELREDRGEIALAQRDELPDLIELSDIRAELHSHTTASDGRWSIEELALAAAARGFHTVAITDHSKGQAQANGLSEARLMKHIEAIRKAAAKLKGTITVLAGSEVDILSDGRLDYGDDLLAELDWVVASPHAALSQDPAKATARLVAACENPYVHVLGHPTGRIINRREGLSPDLDIVFKAAAAHDVAVEINANPLRLDLRDMHARAALHDHGCKLSINTDCHVADHLDYLHFGILTARRAGVTKADVINCLDHDTLHNWRLKKR